MVIDLCSCQWQEAHGLILRPKVLEEDIDKLDGDNELVVVEYMYWWSSSICWSIDGVCLMFMCLMISWCSWWMSDTHVTTWIIWICFAIAFNFDIPLFIHNRTLGCGFMPSHRPAVCKAGLADKIDGSVSWWVSLFSLLHHVAYCPLSYRFTGSAGCSPYTSQVMNLRIDLSAIWAYGVWLAAICNLERKIEVLFY